MKKVQGLREWHGWVSVALALPVVIVSATAVLIAHGDRLQLKEALLPGAMGYGRAEAPDVRGSARGPDGTLYLATNQGLLAQAGDRLQAVPALSAADMRSITSAPGAVYAAGKMGVWANRGDGWTKILPGDAWSVARQPDGALTAAVKGKGLVTSRDGGASWQADAAMKSALSDYAKTAPGRPMTVHNLVMDLHTGKAFFGKTGEWIWIDAVGGVMLFLSFSGLVIWLRARRRKRQLESHVGGSGAVAIPAE